MNNKITTNFLITLFTILGGIAFSGVYAQADSSFSYQGELVDNGIPANDTYDFSVQMLDGNGIDVGTISEHVGVAVDNGLFNLDVDLGLDYFDGFEDYFFEISVRKTSVGGAYTVLSPVQTLQAVPLATNLINGSATTGQVLTFNGFQWNPADPVAGSSPWTVVGSSINYTGQAEMRGTSSVATSNGLLSIGNPNTDHITFDGDDIQARNGAVNNADTLYLNFYSGDVAIGNSSSNIVMNSNVRQSSSLNGMMKYMVFVACSSSGTSSIVRSHNGVNDSAITVANGASGDVQCVIDFPTDIDDRFWQVSPDVSSNDRGAHCTLGGASNQLNCYRYTTSTSANNGGDIMVLVY